MWKNVGNRGCSRRMIWVSLGVLLRKKHNQFRHTQEQRWPIANTILHLWSSQNPHWRGTSWEPSDKKWRCQWFRLAYPARDTADIQLSETGGFFSDIADIHSPNNFGYHKKLGFTESLNQGDIGVAPISPSLGTRPEISAMFDHWRVAKLMV